MVSRQVLAESACVNSARCMNARAGSLSPIANGSSLQRVVSPLQGFFFQFGIHGLAPVATTCRPVGTELDRGDGVGW